MSDDEREEAERRWPSRLPVMSPITRVGNEMRQDMFVAGAEWQASRKVEAASSDTDRLSERLHQIAESQRMDFNSPNVAATLDEAADALSRASQPVQVEVNPDVLTKARAHARDVLGIADDEPNAATGSDIADSFHMLAKAYVAGAALTSPVTESEE